MPVKPAPLRSIDPLRRRSLQERNLQLPAALGGLAAQRQTIGSPLRRELLLSSVLWVVATLFSWATAAALERPLFALPLWVVLSAVVCSVPFRAHHRWVAAYREAYRLLCTTSLPQRIVDHEFWRSFLNDPDRPAQAAVLPQQFGDALVLAARRFDTLLVRPYGGGATGPLSRALFAPLGLSDLAEARLAAIYDFFFDPQLAFEAVIEDSGQRLDLVPRRAALLDGSAGED